MSHVRTAKVCIHYEQLENGSLASGMRGIPPSVDRACSDTSAVINTVRNDPPKVIALIAVETVAMHHNSETATSFAQVSRSSGLDIYDVACPDM